MNKVFLNKVKGVALSKADASIGRLYPIQRTLDLMSLRPYELQLELTNLCNADCVFCPYQFQTREADFMSDEVFHKAVSDYVKCGGGHVALTPVVGDALIDPKFVERVRYLRAIDCIDRIKLITNGILLDKHGIDEVLDSGLTSITISTAGFEENMYRRVFRSESYQRMRRNVLSLLEANARNSNQILVAIALRPDRALSDVMKDADFQAILEFNPEIDFTWSYTSSGKRVTREMLPAQMKLRQMPAKNEACVNLYNGPMVLADGTIMACGCVTAMDASADLSIGNILDTDLNESWRGHEMKQLRSEFGAKELNSTCRDCDMYRNLDFYRTFEGRERAKLNDARFLGNNTKQGKKVKGAFST